MVGAFLFDLDGTLVDSERENAESIAVVLARRGRPMTDEERQFVVGHGWREIYEHLVGHGGVDLSFDALKEAAAIAKEEIVDKSGMRVIPGAVDFVRRAVRDVDGRSSVVSGSSRREIDYVLRMLELHSTMPFFVGAEDVQKGKPSPEGYLLAAGRLGVPPEQCVVFEDSTAGITSAKQAKMRCVALTAANFTGEDQAHADLRVTDFSSLMEQLDGAGEQAPLGMALLALLDAGRA